MSSAWRRKRRRKAARVRSSSGQVGSQGVRNARLSLAQLAQARKSSPLGRPQIEAVAAQQRRGIGGSGRRNSAMRALSFREPSGDARRAMTLPTRPIAATVGADRQHRGARRARTSPTSSRSMRAIISSRRAGGRRRSIWRAICWARAPGDSSAVEQRDLHLRLGALDLLLARAAAPPRRDNRAPPPSVRRRPSATSPA